MMACPEPPTPEVMPEEPKDDMPEVMPEEPKDDMPEVMPSGVDTTSGAVSASIGLYAIAAFLSLLGAVMY